MQQYRECIHRLRLGNGLRKISQQLKIHRSILRPIRTLAIKNGWLDLNVVMPSDQEIFQALNQNSKKAQGSILEPYFEEIKEWRNKKYTAVVIHRLLSEHVLCSIHQVKRYLQKTFPKRPEPIMIRPTFSGKTIEVDFGFLGHFWDKKTNKFKKTWIFSARLRHSRKAYREVVFDQCLATFIKCHINAFEHFGGVTEEIVLDNLKAGVIKSCIDNDQLNRSYQEMAEHYKIMLNPCLPRTPEHKGGVESDMRYIKISFLPHIKERQKFQPYLDLVQLQEMLEKWDREVANIRVVYGVGKSPEEVFKTEEKGALRPLPVARWEMVEWCECEVRRDWRIIYRSSFYSVPYMFISQTVQVKITTQRIYIFFDHQEVASHPRATEKWEFMRNPNHAPPFKEAVLACNREGLLSQAQEVGPYTYAFVQKLLNDPVVNKLKPVRCLLQLTLNYTKERVELACKRALYYNTLRHRSVKDILVNGLDQEQIEEVKSRLSSRFKHARDPKEYYTTVPCENQKEVIHG